MTKLNTTFRNTLAALTASLLCTTLAFTVATAVPGTATVQTTTA